MMANFTVEGCPVADHKPACPRCGGGWPGTKITTESMTRAVENDQINPDLLGCLPLKQRAAEGLLAVAAMEGMD